MDLKQLSLFYSYDLYFTIFQLISTRPRVVEQCRVALCFSPNKKKFKKLVKGEFIAKLCTKQIGKRFTKINSAHLAYQR